MLRQSETEADMAIKQCLMAQKSFALVAGAGSGKTTSLITALDFIRDKKGPWLRQEGRQVACITYTNRAVDVIFGRLRCDTMFLVTTLHSFLWGEFGRFTPNIREALKQYVIPKRIAKNEEDDNGGKSKRAIEAREKIVSLRNAIEHLDEVEVFNYGESNFSDYFKGRLGHEDIIEVGGWLLSSSATLRRIIGQKYPFIFIDEAQDTFESIVNGLNRVCEGEGLPLIGYFGDPMQQIYDKRAGDFAGPVGYVPITKNENYRCAPEVIAVLNAFRGDVKQYAAGTNRERKGSVLVALVRAEQPAAPRKRYTEEQLVRAISRFSDAMRGWGWSRRSDVKQLFLVRQMIARRLGFSELQKLFTGDFASARAQEEYETGKHFLLAPFIETLCPLMAAHRRSDERGILDVLRASSPAFDPRGINAEKSVRAMKSYAMDATRTLAEIWRNKTLREILTFCREEQVCRVPERLSFHLDRVPREERFNPDQHSIEKEDWLVDAFMGMSTGEVEPFAEFVTENTPFSTQHGVKGEEYKDVVVVFDDIEAAWNNYSFTKMLRPTEADDRSETQYERSRKLAYVCFSRAMENLRIVLFTLEPETTLRELVAQSLFDESQISITS